MNVVQSWIHYGPRQVTVKVTNILCSDGRRRVFIPRGQPGTVWTQPGSIRAHGKTITGYIIHSCEHDCWIFVGWGKNGDILPEWE